ncbi:hypothetical protein M413DRAFT_448940 [Hebeloma cylindrosporum]|uniref:Uncharacterized protein n=1 Tax=Hebeloma cylindrosporum TaxID=76867 RepID=A0A0C2Y6Z9_HEBCY|nr:hypothetical protein M413DRAFT_448940 [Hebeloma cylindrosporum h7]
MGQYWVFVNIDKRQTSGFLGKLGEFFSTTTSHSLMYLLAIPAVPLRLESTSANPSTTREFAGAWAGDRIVCFGDYARSWPDGIDGDSLQTVTTSDEDYEDSEGESESPQLLFMASCREYTYVDRGYKWELSYPHDHNWALRNITRKLYVRSDGIPTIDDKKNLTYYIQYGLRGFPGLGQVLLTNILWSDDDSTSMPFSDVQGSWAGDRLDIRLMDDVAEELQEEGWKDISRQEAIKLYNILLQESEVEGDLPDEPAESL